jgi:hypothetical protein
VPCLFHGRLSTGFRLGCTHEYCASCLRETLSTGLVDRSRLPLRCCEVPIDLAVCARLLLSPRDADELLAKTLESQATNKMYCPSCHTFINLDLVRKARYQRFRCHSCGCWLCGDCQTLEHPEFSCPENLSARKGSDELVLLLAETHGWKQCPSCQTMIERVAGCDNMKCANCSSYFCFRCCELSDNHYCH